MFLGYCSCELYSMFVNCWYIHYFYVDCLSEMAFITFFYKLSLNIQHSNAVKVKHPFCFPTTNKVHHKQSIRHVNSFTERKMIPMMIPKMKPMISFYLDCHWQSLSEMVFITLSLNMQHSNAIYVLKIHHKLWLLYKI